MPEHDPDAQVEAQLMAARVDKALRLMGQMEAEEASIRARWGIDSGGRFGLEADSSAASPARQARASAAHRAQQAYQLSTHAVADIEVHRELFLERIAEKCAAFSASALTPWDIVTGVADDFVEELLDDMACELAAAADDTVVNLFEKEFKAAAPLAES